MHDLITTHELKRIIARSAQMEHAFVNVFLDDMVALIVETVSQGEDVHIEGIGTFRRVAVGGGKHHRIVFFADEKMKEGVNAPFSQFEPVVLKEGTKIEPKELPIVNTSEVEAQASADVVIKEDTEMKQNPEPVGDQRREAAEEADSQKYREEMAATEAPVEVSDGNGDMTQRVDKVMENVVSEETGEPCHSVDCAAAKPFASKHSAVTIIIILLALCIVGTGIYFVFRINRSADMPQQAPKPTAPTSQVIEPVKVFPEDSASTTPVIDSVQVIPAPTASTQLPVSDSSDKAIYQYPLNVVLKPGERLTLLALRYYGSKFFWVYIYEANKERYPDPEEIPAGAKLIIPNPDAYGIDAEDAVSLEKAKIKAARILSY